jgi:colanic acid biosynthesis glycosyl transferase WcaI
MVVPFYSPDIGSGAPLITLLCEELIQRGHEVIVITSVPHFKSGKVEHGYRRKFFWKSIENGVTITRVAVPSLNRAKLRNRFIQFICFQIGSTLASMTKKYDVALITNPAIETLIPFVWHSIIRNKPTVWSVFDVYPDVGIKLGIFRSKAVIGIVSYIERICLQHSSYVQIISNSFRPGLNKLDVPDSKMALIPIWVDTTFIFPLPHENRFSNEHHLENQFIVLYAGNIGLSQGLEQVLTAAEILKNQKKLQFIFVGGGAGLAQLQSEVQQRKMTNVQFIPYQPRERLPEVLASANVSLVILKRGIGFDSLPSKTFSALASGRPIIASVDRESETCRLIQQAEAGICIPPDNPSKLVESILKLMGDEDLCTSLGSNGRVWAEKYHSVRSAANQFEELFSKAIKTDIS